MRHIIVIRFIMIEGILEGLTVTAILSFSGIAYKKILDRKLRSKVMSKSRLLVDCFFHSQKTINRILINECNAPIYSDEFIDYSIAKKNGYYQGDRHIFNLKVKNKIETVELPYKELVDFLKNESTIRLDTTDFDKPFQLPDDLLEKTQSAFDCFKSKRMLKTNDNTVRIAGFTEKNDVANEFVCKVQRATYYDQVHTNLTLDRLFSGIEENSVRSLDLGHNNSLRPFEESIMANTLGVSAIWVMEDKTKSSREKRLKYYLMPRSRKTGVYNGMLSSLGGVAQIPDGDTFKECTLEKYAEEEMRREFIEESGVDHLIKTGKLKDSDINITPLAFVRDLIRGGKPQFFFLISTPDIKNKDLINAFRNSFNGTEEFNRNTLSHIRKMNLSPETFCNLLYALKWIQKNKKTNFIDLD